MIPQDPKQTYYIVNSKLAAILNELVNNKEEKEEKEENDNL